MKDARFGAVILIGIWIYFITARSHRDSDSSQAERPLSKHSAEGLRPSETDTWRFDPQQTDLKAIEKADRWVLG